MTTSTEENAGRILAVEDDPTTRAVIEATLTRAGCIVTAVDTIAGALDVLRSETPELCLFDVELPDGEGFELAETLRDDPKMAEVPKIFLTTHSEQSAVLRGFECGAVDYVAKPFRPAELVARVRTHVDLKRTREKLAETLARVRHLSGFIPICAHCKDMRDETGDWHRLESFIRERSEVAFSHGICPSCVRRHYGREPASSNGAATK